ncbi:uncharacterized protein LOC144145571 isoform X2 [Haemaphysalis longicornis]
MAAVAETSGLKSFESGNGAAKSAVEDDDDDLEALRAAALMSMKAKAKHKPHSLNSEPRERPGSNPTYNRFHHSNQRPSAGKPLFNWNQHTRPNLIVIQPVPLEGTEAAPARSAPAAQAAPPPAPQKLLLPQDRWCPQRGQDSPASSGTGQSKRRASGKFSHFESSSESEESDDDLLLFGSNSSRSDASVDGRSSDDDDQNSLTSRGQSTQEDCLDGCLSESTSDLQVCPSPRHETLPAYRAECADQPADACSAKCTTMEHSGCDGSDSGVARAVPPQSGGNWSKTSEEETVVTFTALRTPRKQLSPGREEKSSLPVPSESALALPSDSADQCGLCSTSDSPRRQQERKRSPVTEDHEERKGDPTLENGASVNNLVGAADSRKEDRLAQPLRDRHGSREGTPGSSRSVDSQERSTSYLFEARRRKFESREPVKPAGGKIVLLKGQTRTDGRSPCRNTSPLPSPPARTRSRSRSRSGSPPFLRSVLSVVKRGPAELFPSCVDAKKKRRSGRTVEIIVHSVGGEESSDASDRAASSKLPVHLRLGESPSKKKKSKRKRSSRDLVGNNAKRKHAKARRSLNKDARWPGPEHRRRRKTLRDASP